MTRQAGGLGHRAGAAWGQPWAGTTPSRAIRHNFGQSRADLIASMDGVQYQYTVLADTPKGYWRLGESDRIAQDISGSGFHGSHQQTTKNERPTATLTAAPQLSTTIGTGTGGIHLGTLTPSYAYPCVEMIYKHAAAPVTNLSRLWGTNYEGSSEFAFEVGVNTSNDINVYLTFTDGAPGWTNTNVTLNLNTRYHLVVGWDGLQVFVYLNGVYQTSVGTAWAGRVLIATTAARSIGGDVSSSLEGIFQDVAYYNYRLSPERITRHYAAIDK